MEFRNRVAAAIDAAMTGPAAAERFGVSVESAVVRHRCFRETGSVDPFPMGGDSGNGPVRFPARVITRRVNAQPVIKIAKIRERIEVQGHALAYGPVWRLRVRQNHKVKSITANASEQNRGDVMIQRRKWRKDWMDVSAFRLIFDEKFCVNTQMARTRGRAFGGKQCIAHIPHGQPLISSPAFGLRRCPTPIFQSADASFRLIAAPAEVPVAVNFLRSVAPRRNATFDSLVLRGVAKPVRVIWTTAKTPIMA